MAINGRYMARYGLLSSTSIPNMVSGVSQQPPSLRLPANSAEQINAWPSVINGLNKRPNVEHIAKIPDLASPNATGYIIDRDDGYQYIVVISSDGLKVYDFNGNQQNVSFPSEATYLTLADDPSTSYRFCTVGDTTFILNRDVIPQMDDFGEDGSYDFTYTSVDDPTARDAIVAPVVGQIVYVSSEGSFYQWRDTDATAEVDVWHFVGNSTPGSAGPLNNNNAAVPVGYTAATALPSNIVVGAKYCIKYQYAKLQSGCAAYDAKGNCQAYNYDYQYAYKQYIGQQASPAVPGQHGWIKMKGNELSRSVANRLDPRNMGTVYITQSVSNVNYSIYYNDVLVAFYLTPKGVDATTAVPGTDVIATNLAAAVTTAVTGNPSLLPAGYTMQVIGSTITFNGLDEDGKLATTCTNGDKAIKSYTTEIDAFTSLPPNEKVGRIVRVKGDVKTNGDDYYVVFTDKGLWEETWGWNQASKPVDTTMPHALVRNADNDWTFKPWDWQARAAGDLTSNPSPSFIGSAIHDMFLYSDRLVFLADENIILSETNNFENFFRTSLAVLTDSDPIDLAVLSSGVDTLWHGVPYNDDLLLLSDRIQHRFAYQNFLGPKNIQIKYSTSFNVSRTVRPVNMGGSIYFVDDKPEYTFCKVWEYFPQVNQTGDDAEDVTGPVPQYIPSNITNLAGSPRVKAVVAQSAMDPAALYIYRFYWGNNSKIQNAWGRWTFPDVTKILWVGFDFNYLWMVVQRPDGFYIERIKCDENVARSSDQNQWLIDRVSDPLAMVYDPLSDTTLVTLPWTNTAGTVEVCSSRQDPIIRPDDNYVDHRHTVTVISGNQVKVDGDLTDATLAKVGIQYGMTYTFSKPYLRQPRANGQEMVVLDTLRLQMKYLTIYAENTAAYRAIISYPGRPDRTIEFDHMRPDDEATQISGEHVRSWTDRIAIGGNNEDLTVNIVNDTPFNAQFTAAEWEFVANIRAKNRY